MEGIKMTAKELMIGDLVLIKPEMKPIKVAAVHQKKIGYHVRADKLNWVRFGLLEPIPLTPELLVANGFDITETKNEFYSTTLCKIQGPKGSWFEDLGQRITFLYDRHGDFIFPIASLNNNDHDNIMGSFKYVHQLQQAFRMLKLFDLADNIKTI